MSFHTRFEDKIDVLDIIISILRDHEESLSKVVDKLDAVSKTFASIDKKIIKLEGILQRQLNLTSMVGQRLILVECKKWSEFKEASMEASLVAFETGNNILSITSSVGEVIFKYSEKLPEVEEVVPTHSGVLSQKKLQLNPDNVKRWLSEELKVPEDRILEGNISLTDFRGC